jgi:hypothetical protein
MKCRRCGINKNDSDFLKKDKTLCKKCYATDNNKSLHKSFESYASTILKGVRLFCSNHNLTNSLSKSDLIKKYKEQDETCPTCNKKINIVVGKKQMNPKIERLDIEDHFNQVNFQIVHQKCQNYSAGGVSYSIEVIKNFRTLKKKGLKKCIKCNEIKEIIYFHKAKSKARSYTNDGLCNTCINCLKEDPIVKANNMIRSIRQSIHKIPYKITPDDLVQIFNKQGGKCYRHNKQKIVWKGKLENTACYERKDVTLGFTFENTILVAAKNKQQHLNHDRWSIEEKKEEFKLKEEGLRECLKCNEILEIKYFLKDKNERVGEDAEYTRCKSCRILDRNSPESYILRAINNINKKKWSTRKSILINKTDVISKFEEQGGLCAKSKEEITLEGGKINSFVIDFKNRSLGLLKADNIILVKSGKTSEEQRRLSPKAGHQNDQRKRANNDHYKKFIQEGSNDPFKCFREIWCLSCKESKKRELFTKGSHSDFSGECKACVTKKIKKVRVKKLEGYQTYYEKLGTLPLEFFKKIVKTKKISSKKRGLEFSLTAGNLMEIFNKQKGLCFYTKEKFILYPTKSRNTLSLDRYDNSKGYIKGNVNFSTNKFNLIKNDISYQALVKVCIIRGQYIDDKKYLQK